MMTYTRTHTKFIMHCVLELYIQYRLLLTMVMAALLRSRPAEEDHLLELLLQDRARWPDGRLGARAA